MTGIEDKLICLNLNNVWQPIGCKTVRQAISDLVGGEYLAIDIQYEKIGDSYVFSSPRNLDPVSWEQWIKLPVREFDFSISSKTLCVRVPTVLIAKNYSKIPIRRVSLNQNNIRIRDKNTCQYTGRVLRPEDGNIDHVIPKAKGGGESWDNLVYCDKNINAKKGNKLNHEIGLKLLREAKEPAPIMSSSFFIEHRHVDWKHFFIK